MVWIAINAERRSCRRAEQPSSACPLEPSYDAPDARKEERQANDRGGFVTQDPRSGLPTQADPPRKAWLPESQLMIRIFAVALGGLLAGYMFLGRGFAHVGIGPVYVGDWILLVGVATAGFAAIRAGARAPFTWTIALLLAFITLGAARTLPYLGTHGMDALRDGALWGYAGFALMVYLLADRALVVSAFRLYGWVVPIFALWLPISWNLFASYSIDPTRPGSVIPIVFFKGGDMGVHTVGAIAFLVIGASVVGSARTFVWRMLISLPLLWTVFVAGTSNRGALLTAAVGIAVVAMLAWRSRNWLPLFAATGVFVIALVFQGALAAASRPAPIGSVGETPIPSEARASSRSVQPAVSPSGAIAASSAGRPSDGTADAGSTPQPPAGDRLAVANPGFELGPLNNGTIEGWAIRANGPHNLAARGAYRGARFASMQNVDKAYEDTITSSRIPFKDGPNLAVTAWVKAIAAQPALEIYVNWYDSFGTLISSVFLSRLETNGATTWQECAGAVSAPASATQAEIVLYEASGKATMGIDEITVRSGDFPVTSSRGRPASLQQLIENVLSLFGSSSDGGLEGSKQFRLAWWGKIVDYTVFGNHFWTGKGFGINLADDDGFQSTADHSLRSPHNSEMTVLARMGVPGLVLWVLLQGAFGAGVLRVTLAHRRAGDAELAAMGGLIVAYWVAMLVNTSFDPYLEGPQGGIWFWVLFGLGLVVMRLAPRRRKAA